jgi:hypothetical protein
MRARLRIWRMRTRKTKRRAAGQTLRLADFDAEKPAMNFRLYHDEEVPMMRSKVMKVETQNPSCDNDCPTEERFLNGSIRLLEAQISTALTEFKENANVVKNMQKYRSLDLELNRQCPS